MTNKEIIKQETKETLEIIDTVKKQYHVPASIINEIKKEYIERMKNLAKKIKD